MHQVKCVYCQQLFDRDREPTVAVSTKRYAHKKCYDQIEGQKTQEERDYELLEKYLMELFNTNYVSARIKKQIKEYKEEYNYTISGMYKALVWWYDIQHSDITKANDGIGIIPYIYDQAYKYYYKLWLAETANSLEEITNYNHIIKEVEIGSPRVYVKPPRLFKLEEGD